MWTIQLPRFDKEGLFDNSDLTTLETIDVEASIEKYTETLIGLIVDTYDDLEVAVDGNPSSGYYISGGVEEDWEEHLRLTNAVMDIAASLYDNMPAWLVDKEVGE